MKTSSFALVTVFVLAGCASTGPDTIRTAPSETVSVAEALAEPERARGHQVRWGGQIADISHGEDYTRLEIVARPLQRRGRPETGDESLGRFYARVDTFLDPDVYAAGRRVTVAGTVEGAEEGLIGEFTYVYPVVRVFDHHLWERSRRPQLRTSRSGYTRLYHAPRFHHRGVRRHGIHPRSGLFPSHRTGIRHRSRGFRPW
jgi:outer membrane lipoprotein